MKNKIILLALLISATIAIAQSDAGALRNLHVQTDTIKSYDGTTRPSLPNGVKAGASDQFLVNSSGNITKINNVATSFPSSQGGASSILSNDGAGNLSWSAGGSMVIGNNVSGGTSGSVLFVNGSGNLAQDNAKFFWDTTNKRLGIGTTAPDGKLQVDTGGTNESTHSIWTDDATGDVIIGPGSPVGQGFQIFTPSRFNNSITFGGSASEYLNSYNSQYDAGGTFRFLMNGFHFQNMAGGMTFDFTETLNTSRKPFEIKGDSALPLTGTVDVAATTAVTGSGTAFLTELATGDAIKVNGETRTVSSIADDTDLTTTSAFSSSGTGFPGFTDEDFFDVETADANVRMKMTNHGKLGIGTATPTKALDVVGDVGVTGKVGIGGAGLEKLHIGGGSAITLNPDLYVSGPAEFSVVEIDSYMETAGGIAASIATANSTFLQVKVTGDSCDGFDMDNTGIMAWNDRLTCPGPDTNLYRGAAGVLKTDNNINIAGNGNLGGNVPHAVTQRTGTASAGSCTKQCLSGEIVTGGGCSHSAAIALQNSYASASDTWSCAYLAYVSGTCTATAVCAKY